MEHASGGRNLTRVSVLLMAIMNNELLEFALIGLEQRRQHVVSKIAELKEQLSNGGRRGPGRPAKSYQHAPEAPSPLSVSTGGKTRNSMSASARKRIADAQRKRWAAYHAAQSAT